MPGFDLNNSTITTTNPDDVINNLFVPRVTAMTRVFASKEDCVQSDDKDTKVDFADGTKYIVDAPLLLIVVQIPTKVITSATGDRVSCAASRNTPAPSLMTNIITLPVDIFMCEALRSHWRDVNKDDQ
ncbi:hypothetical protein Btru_014207 [Bulinus truncatus]|nr:hypothetical protein Btru_014207 [Bulinus truncatus]